MDPRKGQVLGDAGKESADELRRAYMALQQEVKEAIGLTAPRSRTGTGEGQASPKERSNSTSASRDSKRASLFQRKDRGSSKGKGNTDVLARIGLMERCSDMAKAIDKNGDIDFVEAGAMYSRLMNLVKDLTEIDGVSNKELLEYAEKSGPFIDIERLRGEYNIETPKAGNVELGDMIAPEKELLQAMKIEIKELRGSRKYDREKLNHLIDDLIANGEKPANKIEVLSALIAYAKDFSQHASEMKGALKALAHLGSSFGKDVAVDPIQIYKFRLEDKFDIGVVNSLIDVVKDSKQSPSQKKQHFEDLRLLLDNGERPTPETTQLKGQLSRLIHGIDALLQVKPTSSTNNMIADALKVDRRSLNEDQKIMSKASEASEKAQKVVEPKRQSTRVGAQNDAEKRVRPEPPPKPTPTRRGPGGGGF